MWYPLEHAGVSDNGSGTSYWGDNSFIDNLMYIRTVLFEPVALTASNITSNSANLSWTPGGTETAWNVEYGLVGFTQGTGIIAAVTDTIQLSGLTLQQIMISGYVLIALVTQVVMQVLSI